MYYTTSGAYRKSKMVIDYVNIALTFAIGIIFILILFLRSRSGVLFSVEFLLGFLKAVVQQEQRGLGSGLNGVLEFVSLLFLGRGQNEVGNRHASRGTADAAANSIPILGLQLVADGAQTVVARMAAAELHAHGA